MSIRQWLLVLAICAQSVIGNAFALQADNPLLVLEGDGLKMVVTSSPDDENFIGEIHLSGKVFPFKASLKEENGQEKIVGTFTANGAAFGFSTHQPEGQAHTIFTTGTKTYKLMPVETAPPKPVTPEKPGVNNPLDGPMDGPKADNPLEGPKESNPLDGPAPVRPAPVNPEPMKPKEINPLENTEGKPAAVNAPVGGRDEEIRLQQVVFPDVSMGGLPAYTMSVPAGWKADGRIEWSIGDVSYPQKHINITATDQRRVQIPPQMKMGYLEVDPRWIAEQERLGMPRDPNPHKGEPPPQDFGLWLLAKLQQNNPDISNMHLISQQRDELMEKAMAQVNQAMGAPQNAQVQPLIITLGMVQDGVRVRQEHRVIYTVNEPSVTQTSRLTLWTVDIMTAVSGPDATFDRDKGLLYSIANSLRATPKWWTASQELLAQLAAGRAKANLDIIRQMGEQAKSRALSNEQMTSFRNNMSSGDRIQDKQLDRIQEVQPYGDVDGSTVKLSIHYKYTYGDGKGNYVQTNQKLERPGEYQELEAKN